MLTRKKYNAMLRLTLKPEAWAALLGVIILDPDGWRSPTQSYLPKDWEAPLELREFLGRALPSTMKMEDGDDDFHTALNYRAEDELGWVSGPEDNNQQET